MRRLRRELHPKGKRANTPAKGRGKGKMPPEGGAGRSDLGRCKVESKKELKGVLVRRTARSKPPTHEAKLIRESKPK